MKKLLLASLLLVAGMSAQAANTSTPFLVSTTASSVSVTCTLLTAATQVNYSAGNVGSVDCDDVATNIGVAFGNNNGKGVLYSAGSIGGGVNATTGATMPFSATGNTQTSARVQSARTS